MPFGINQMYFWVLGTTTEGRTVVIGPFGEESEARINSEDLENSNVFKLKTRDQTKATRSIKQLLRQKGVPTDEALQRVGHPSIRKENNGGLFDGDPFKDDGGEHDQTIYRGIIDKLSGKR